MSYRQNHKQRDLAPSSSFSADLRLSLMCRGGTELLLYSQEQAWQSPEWPGARALRMLWLQILRTQFLPL